EYGWIKPGRLLDQIGAAAIHAVETFIEKPDEATAREARAAGSLWNTMVLAAKGTQLSSLGWKCFPDMMSRFERLKDTSDPAEQLRVIEAIYDALPNRNFSSHLLQRVPERLAVMEMQDVLWSDWGNPERILSGLENIGRQPALAEAPRPFLYVG